MAEILEASLTVSGDFLGVPRARKVSAEALQPGEHSELSKLISAVERDGNGNGAGRQGSEVRQYEIALRMADGERTFQACEGGESTAFRALRAWLETHGRWAAR
jgi:hypothetical protein